MLEYQKVHYSYIDSESADDIERSAEDLKRLGIEIHDPTGSTCVSEDREGYWKEIGRIVVWAEQNRIDVRPYQLLVDAELGYLRTAAWNAWMKRPAGHRPKYWRRGTHRIHGCYYECIISIEAFEDDRVVRMIQAARTFRSWQDQQFQRIYNATV
ncbi:hypothetical protein ACFXG4_04225 [Nocardia sp. NPDC059246]|uniref:hypothetical protein n=1 Tax=unclassified Nocardia TaxID=2637762 RepID=UPI0036947478